MREVSVSNSEMVTNRMGCAWGLMGCSLKLGASFLGLEKKKHSLLASCMRLVQSYPQTNLAASLRLVIPSHQLINSTHEF
jgi:hypothetical protein